MGESNIGIQSRMSAVAKNKIIILQVQLIKIGGKLGGEVYIKKLSIFINIKIKSQLINSSLFLLLSITKSSVYYIQTNVRRLLKLEREK